MVAKKKKLAPMEEKKMELWQWCLEHGYTVQPQPLGINCLHNNAKTKERMRLKFGDKVLDHQAKRELTKEEKRTDPHHHYKWVSVEQAGYGGVKIGDGGLIFKK